MSTYDDSNISFFKMKYLQLDKYIKPFKIQNGKFITKITYNTSIVHIGNNLFLYAIRVSVIETNKNQKVIPGNSNLCKKPFSIGNNFMWNNWNFMGKVNKNFKLREYTKFLIGNHNENFFYVPKNKFILNDKIKNDILLKKINKGVIFLTDVRLQKIGNFIYIYSLNLQTNYKCSISNSKIIFVDVDKNKLSNGKNLSVVDIISINDSNLMIYMDWFYINGKYGPGIYYVKRPIFSNSIQEIKLQYNSIPFNHNYVLNGMGSTSTKDLLYIDNNKLNKNYGITPLFSFGTPHILYKSFDENYYIGVGHIKIHSDIDDYIYKNNSNIQSFRNNLYEDFENYFGEIYIRHKGSNKPSNCKGFIYMMYFYLIDTTFTKMLISDSYLPINLDYELDYRFSLIFPMGLELYNDRLIVSAGEGDFYSVIMEFNVEEIIKVCKHNVRFLNMNNYNYKLLLIYQNECFIDSSFYNIIKRIKPSFTPIKKLGKESYNKDALNKKIVLISLFFIIFVIIFMLLLFI